MKFINFIGNVFVSAMSVAFVWNLILVNMFPLELQAISMPITIVLGVIVTIVCAFIN